MYEGVNVTDAGTLAALRGVGFGGYGYGGDLLRQDGSAVKEGIRGNRDIQLLEGINRNASDQSLNNTVVRGNEFLTDRINQQFINERFSSMERQMSQNALDGQRDRTEILRAVDAVKCCCEANSAKIDNLAALNAKDLEITKLQLQLSQCQGNGPGRGN